MARIARPKRRTRGGWIGTPGWMRTYRGRIRRRRRCVHPVESLESRTLLSAVAAVWGTFDSSHANDQSTIDRSEAEQRRGQRPFDRSSRQTASGNREPDVGRQDQRYVEVLIFINSGLLNTGHADIALVDRDATIVYGQHGVGNGNGGFRNSTFKRRTLDVYLQEESPAGFRVYVSRVPVTEQQFREIKGYLNHQWQNDVDYNMFDDNCSQNIGYVLKQWNLLSDWPGVTNVINDDAFQLPEGDLYNDWLKPDKTWTHHAPGYLAPILDGTSLFDSVQNTPPAGLTPNPSTGTGSSSGHGNGSGNRGRSSSSIPDDEGNRNWRIHDRGAGGWIGRPVTRSGVS